MNVKTTTTLVVLWILFFPLYTIAQDAFSFPKMETVPTATTSEENLIFYSYHAEQTASISVAWENGILYTTTNDVLYITARYIPELSQIQIKIKESILTLFDSKVKACLIGKKTYVYSDYMDGLEKENSYFELLANGQQALLKQYTRTNNGLTITYLAKSKFTPAQEFKAKQKNILTLFPNQKEVIKTYIKTNQLDLQKELNLVAIFKYANDLLDQDFLTKSGATPYGN